MEHIIISNLSNNLDLCERLVISLQTARKLLSFLVFVKVKKKKKSAYSYILAFLMCYTLASYSFLECEMYEGGFFSF